MDADQLLADLDPDQRAAVATPSTLVAVVAGAGSGKTRVLTRRIAHRLATGSADPDHTLAITFTREAAGELRRRLHRLGHREAIEVGTFHSVMLAVLRQRWADTDRPARTITADRRRLLEDVIEDQGGRRADLAVADAEIAWAAAQGIGADTYAERAHDAGRRPAGGIDRARSLFEGYERIKRRRGVIDFDDVLSMTLGEARRDDHFAEALRWRFRHLHVDEAQDLNPVQHALVDLLRRGRDDVFLVGDPAQAIFGFNGADPSLLVDVETRFPGIEIVRLPVNHRCTPQVVAAGRHVLDAGGQPTDLRSARPDGPAVERFRAEDEDDEADRIATLIARGDGALVRSSNVAVLARTHAQLAPIAASLAARGVAMRRSSNRAGSPIQVAVRAAAALGSPGALRGWAHDVLDDVAALETARTQVELAERSSRDHSAAARRTALRDVRATLELVEAERQVAAAVLEFLRDHPRGDGAALRSWIATTSPFESREDGGVELLTFHAAKGREWHTVVVAGVETSLVPHKSATTAATRAEEARLLYVALTRATDRLVICGAARRGGYERKVSPLVEHIDSGAPEVVPPPADLLDRRPPRRVDHHGVLRDWRAEAARRANVLPTQLCSDRDLVAIARTLPSTVDELVAATSMGPMTAERLAPELLPLLDPDPTD